MHNSTSKWIWTGSVLVFLLSMGVSALWLPERVATHFDFRGDPDRWMTKEQHLILFTLFGLGFSSLFPALFYVIRFLPASLLNVTNPEYWRSAEHYPQACQFLFHQSFPLAAMAIIFVSGINLALVQANQTPQPHLHMLPTLLLTMAFLGGMGWWTLRLFRFFREIPRG
jgi:uncharacterized membrane protein